MYAANSGLFKSSDEKFASRATEVLAKMNPLLKDEPRLEGEESKRGFTLTTCPRHKDKGMSLRYWDRSFPNFWLALWYKTTLPLAAR
jgi:hypothetical protein